MMNKKEIQSFIEAAKAVRKLITDEQAVLVPALYPTWKDDQMYEVGDRVLYNGNLYKVLVSQANCSPVEGIDFFVKL